MRTDAEIVAQVKAIQAGDFFGFEAEPLIHRLDFATAMAAGFLKEDATEEAWGDPKPRNGDGLRQEAKDYLSFAFGKAEDHRGLSAGRSVAKMRAYLWLMGNDAALAEYDAAPYRNYGVPQLLVAAKHLGVEAPPDDTPLGRMGRGLSCHEGCDDGCGS